MVYASMCKYDDDDYYYYDEYDVVKCIMMSCDRNSQFSIMYNDPSKGNDPH